LFIDAQIITRGFEEAVNKDIKIDEELVKK
jgi:hypothetical protein